VDPQEGQIDSLGWSAESNGGSLRVSVNGELDVAVADRLEEAINRLPTDAATMVMDLGSLNFIDSTGLRLLLRLKKGAETTGRKLLISRVSEPVSRLLDVSGLIRVFDFVANPCPVCGRETPAGSSVCAHCGSRF
jgi:anti-anti-sigma factor